MWWVLLKQDQIPRFPKVQISSTVPWNSIQLDLRVLILRDIHNAGPIATDWGVSIQLSAYSLFILTEENNCLLRDKSMV